MSRSTTPVRGRCPDWRSLDPDAPEGSPEELAWRRGVAHSADCLACRRAALARDPAALFRSTPEVRLAPAEVDAMRERVIGVLRSREVTGAGSGRTGGREEERPRWRRFASAAALLLAVVLGLVEAGPRVMGGSGPAAEAAMQAAESRGQLSAEEEAMLEESLASQPLVEDLEVLGGGQVTMQLASDVSELAWVVNSGLDEL